MMFAIVRTGGKQFKVTEGMKLQVPTIDSKVGEKLTFSEVLLLSAGEKRYSGNPTIKGAKVQVEILRHGRDDKKVIFKYKRRKSYHLKKGHRQGFTEVLIKTITVPGDIVKDSPEKEAGKRAKETEAVTKVKEAETDKKAIETKEEKPKPAATEDKE
jgi:large subunit ribosomal protein L21